MDSSRRAQHDFAAARRQAALKSALNAERMALLIKMMINDISRNTRVFDEEKESQLPRFHHSEIVLGNILGRGAFCSVNEIKQISLGSKCSNPLNDQTSEESMHEFRNLLAKTRTKCYHYSTKSKRINAKKVRDRRVSPNDKSCEWDDTSIFNQVQDRQYIAGHCSRLGDSRYALKRISGGISRDSQEDAIIDLAIEARFLAVVHHPNIIKIRGISLGDPCRQGFFLVLDRLYDTLEGRMVKWKARQKKIEGLMSKVIDRNGKKRSELWWERVHNGYDIASAMSYLHSCNIIYRDLKPENIGYDVRGVLKIFDFGLAQELRPKEMFEDGTYELTGFTGTIRYMPPEVAQSQRYNSTVDVYSFSILLW
eukprot:CAMPEP_0194378660 /NCGR_PEP_ID=MMETSP0174-20130528/36769_1 /TAXON_ID=216777 /ORGANISM="Proboscia alata, Strain PI-D3" /LENGTH=366 /DNA_ID=CAMNT_0039160859 /DNA_START=107 /DNA_END=1204 /DNA_ORIENTATION=-